MNLEHLERWRFFMKNMCSPSSYIDWGFYFMISSALQRRVWIGHDKLKLFPNTYVIFVGDPSVGKGLVIRQVTDILKHHKLIKGKNNVTFSEKEQDVLNSTIEVLKHQEQAKNIIRNDVKLLIPLSADTASFEALVTCTARSIRAIEFNVKGPDGTLMQKTYTHCSLCACLEELSTLFRKNTEDIVTYFLKMYDCGDFDKETKTSGEDHIKRGCLNMIAGTIPNFMRRAFTDDLINDGFSSRTFFVYETKNRFARIHMSVFTDEQIAAYDAIVEHIGKLGRLYGKCEYTPEANEFLDTWWIKFNEDNSTMDRNKSSKMLPYYGRKGIHVQKLAMIIHFISPDVRNFTVTLDEVKEALRILEEVETKMHLALDFGGRNPAEAIAKSVVRFLNREGPKTYTEIYVEHFGMGTDEECKAALDYLEKANVIARKDADHFCIKGEEDLQRVKLTPPPEES